MHQNKQNGARAAVGWNFLWLRFSTFVFGTLYLVLTVFEYLPPAYCTLLEQKRKQTLLLFKNWLYFGGSISETSPVFDQ